MPIWWAYSAHDMGNIRTFYAKDKQGYGSLPEQEVGGTLYISITKRISSSLEASASCGGTS